MTKKGGDAKMGTQDSNGKAKRGRHLKVRLEGETILSNGLFERQQDWLAKESRAKGIEAAPYLRFIVDAHIDAVEASRGEIPVTPEDDAKFEELVNKAKSKSSTKSKSK